MVGTSAWISSTITVSIERSASRAFEVSSRYSDSGVVIRMSAGSRWKRARSRGGVSPVRTATAGTTKASPRRGATLAMPGERRAQVALDVDRQRLERRHVEHAAALASSAGSGSNISRLMHQRNAASVLPLPVGARISVDSPRAMPASPAPGRVGAANDAREPLPHGRLESGENVVATG